MFLPRYCRENPTEATAMKMFHHDELLDVGPDELRTALATVNDGMYAALFTAVDAEFGTADVRSIAVAEAAVKAIPYGLVRDYIARAAPIPDWVDTVTASGAVLAEFRARS